MSEKKNMTGKENSFHMENFRRRSRYAAVFLVLILTPVVKSIIRKAKAAKAQA